MKELHKVTVAGINYLVDKDAEPQDKNYVLSAGSIAPLYLDGVINTAAMLLENYWYPVVGIQYPHKLEGLIQYKLPDEVELANAAWDDNHVTERQAFIQGYKATKALYSEAQVREAFGAGFNSAGARNYKGEENDYIQSLNKPREVESVEVEYESKIIEHIPWSKELESKYDYEKGYPKTAMLAKLTEEGMLLITKVNYKL